jgi:ribosome maturation factor RimP
MAGIAPEVVETVTEVLAARGLGLYDIDVTGSGRARVVRVLVTARGGVDLDAVTAAAEALSPALDAPVVARHLPGPYALVVCSAGLERPLRTPSHYRGAIGETVSVKIHDAPRQRGRLIAVDDDGMSLEVVGADATESSTVRVAFSDVVQARTVFEWGEAATKPRRRHGAGEGTKEVARR